MARGADCNVFFGRPELAAVDSLFLVALGAIVGREILAGRNLKNLPVLLIVSIFAAGNVLFHVEAQLFGSADYGKRIGIGAAIIMIVLIGGRVTPSFTRNWLAKQGEAKLPGSFNIIDRAAMISAALALLSWVVFPETRATAIFCLVAAVLNFLRLARWRGYASLKEPLVTILHVGYFFVPLGFLFQSLAVDTPAVVTQAVAVHTWTAGAIGTMTLAIMTRASLGHTGRTLTARNEVAAIYLAVILSAAARLAYGFGLLPNVTIEIAGVLWVTAFLGFAAEFAPALLGAKREG